MPKQISIDVLGAGPAGLTAARILTRHGKPCRVFEADLSARSRHHATGKVLWLEKREPGIGTRPKSDRIVPRERLSKSLSADVVQWGKPMTNGIVLLDGRYGMAPCGR